MGWKNIIEQGFEDFREQGGGKAIIRVVLASEFASMMQAADNGDEVAQRCFMAISQWTQIADQADAGGIYPACAYCKKELHRGSVEGFILLQVMEKGSTGLAGAFCEDCANVEYDKLIADFVKCIEEEYGAEFSPVH